MTVAPSRTHRRLTIRARLTVTYAGLVTGCGVVLIAIVYIYLRFVPSYRIAEASLAPYSLNDMQSVQPTRPIEITSASDFLDNFLVASTVALVLLAALGGVVGWIVAGRIIRPLAAINAAAIRASAGSLDHRVALEGPHDEIRDLSETFDRMLASLERSFAAQHRFAANASHELRTPLATTQTMIDVALADPDIDVAALRALATRIREVNLSSTETVDALLDLADANSAVRASEAVDLAEIATTVLAELADVATSSEIEIVAPRSAAATQGDAVLLRQAVSNLVRNAIQHNRPGGRVVIDVASTAAGASVTVVNTGHVVAAESLTSLTEPFVRGAGRGLTRRSGHGLGLAIVAAVASAHHGSLTLESNSGGGLTARLELPLARG